MTFYHDPARRPKRVAEPVQVYLDASERARLDRLTAWMDASKSEVIRRGLEALEQQYSDPAAHPALRIIGLASAEPGAESDLDVALDHDRFLAESEIESWGTETPDGAPTHGDG